MDTLVEDIRKNQIRDDKIAALEKAQAEILDILRPMSEAYKSAAHLGKWLTALAVFISITMGVIAGIRGLFNKY